MVTINPFDSKHLIEKLVNHYGLPAFLFQPVDALNFFVTDGNKKKAIRLVPLHNVPVTYEKSTYFIFEDLWRSKESIVASKIMWLADYQLNYAARNCNALRINAADAEKFMNENHLMGFAKGGFHYGLIHEKELIAVASFSKGRKMNDLPEEKRSFELIRFASKKFIAVSGGFSKLLANFCADMQPGDIMTYVDPLFGDVESLKKNKFEITGTTPPYTVYVNPNDYTRHYGLDNANKNYIALQNKGNLKLKRRFV